MIDVQELRIGNWVHNGSFEEPWLAGDYTDLMSISRASPITLTPEILEKCGFERQEVRRDEFWVLQLETCQFSLLGDIVGNGYIFYYQGEFEIKTLHQLQNLLLALTGTELNYEL